MLPSRNHNVLTLTLRPHLRDQPSDALTLHINNPNVKFQNSGGIKHVLYTDAGHTE